MKHKVSNENKGLKWRRIPQGVAMEAFNKGCVKQAGEMSDQLHALTKRNAALMFHASLNGNVKVFEAGYNLGLNIIMLRNLMHAYQHNKSHEKAAERIGLTRPGLYVRVKTLGLKTSDFTQDLPLDALIYKSKVIMSQVGRIEFHFNGLSIAQKRSIRKLEKEFGSKEMPIADSLTP